MEVLGRWAFLMSDPCIDPKPREQAESAFEDKTSDLGRSKTKEHQQVLNPKPYTRNPTPYTLHPTTYTLYPSPDGGRGRSGECGGRL